MFAIHHITSALRYLHPTSARTPMEAITAELARLAEGQALILGKTRRRPKASDLASHWRALEANDYRCPCCYCQRSRADFECDHFFCPSKATICSVWLICKACHQRITAGYTERVGLLDRFKVYLEHLQLPVQLKLSF